MRTILGLDDAILGEFCRRHGIRRLALFGSVLNGTDRLDSDIDLLVEFEAARVPGLMGMSAIEIALGELLGRKVDLRTAQDLSPHFRDDVVRRSKVAYAA